MTKGEIIMETLEDIDEMLEYLYTVSRCDMADFDAARRAIETGMQKFNDYATEC